MTYEEYIELLQACSDRGKWGPELFEQVKNYVLSDWQEMFSPAELHRRSIQEKNGDRSAWKTRCVFNDLRQRLPPGMYDDFDIEYCEYIRPGNRVVHEYCKRLYKKEGDESRRDKIKKMTKSEVSSLILRW